MRREGEIKVFIEKSRSALKRMIEKRARDYLMINESLYNTAIPRPSNELISMKQIEMEKIDQRILNFENTLAVLSWVLGETDKEPKI